MKTFVQTLYDYNNVGTVTEDNSDKEDGMTLGIVTCIRMVTSVGYSDIIGTVTEEENSDEEDEMEIAMSESRPPRGDRQLVNYLDFDSDGEPCSSKQQPILDEDFEEEIDLVLVPIQKNMLVK